MNRWPTISLALMNVAIVLISTPALAQVSPVDPATSAVAELMKQGILGLLVILEGVVIHYLYKQVQVANAKFLDMAIRQTEIFAEATRTLKKNEEMLEKVLDLVIRR